VLLDGGEQLDGERDLVGPVLLGLDDVDAARARVREPAAPRRSCSAAVAVTSASSTPSATSTPSTATASVVMWCPQLRTSSSERPGSTSGLPVRRGVLPVAVHDPLDGLAALLERSR
jgi:hypothetical protein